jgi:hypothetical protein
MGYRHKRNRIREIIHKIKDWIFYTWFRIRYYRMNKESKRILNEKINKFIDEEDGTDIKQD